MRPVLSERLFFTEVLCLTPKVSSEHISFFHYTIFFLYMYIYIFFDRHISLKDIDKQNKSVVLVLDNKNMLRTNEENHVFSKKLKKRFVTALNLIKCLKQIKWQGLLLTFAHFSEIKRCILQNCFMNRLINI